MGHNQRHDFGFLSTTAGYTTDEEGPVRYQVDEDSLDIIEHS